MNIIDGSPLVENMQKLVITAAPMASRGCPPISQRTFFYESADETLAKNGFGPNRKPGQVGFTQHG